MIKTRTASASDKDFLWQLKVASMKEYVHVVYGWNDADQLRFFENGFHPEVMQIIQVNGKDIGMYELQEREEDLYLTRIEILPEEQGQGIGTTVIEEMLQTAQKSQLPLRLQVFKINPAQKLYSKLGFKIIGETETHIQMESPNKALQRTQTSCAPEL